MKFILIHKPYSMFFFVNIFTFYICILEDSKKPGSISCYKIYTCSKVF